MSFRSRGKGQYKSKDQKRRIPAEVRRWGAAYAVKSETENIVM